MFAQTSAKELKNIKYVCFVVCVFAQTDVAVIFVSVKISRFEMKSFNVLFQKYVFIYHLFNIVQRGKS